MMFSATLRSGSTAVSWATIAMPALSEASGLANVMGSPSIRILPSLGRICPDRTPSSVDLPEPFSPSSPVITPTPSGTDRSAPRNACTPP